MATAELAEVSRSIRSAMGESAGQFRQAATASNANLSKIVKDIATTFSAQRKDITDLHNAIQEGQYAAEQTNDKIDGLVRIFQESASIQTNMLGSINDVSKNIRILNRNVESMNNNISNNLVGSGGGNILSSLTAGFSNVATALGAAAIGGAIGTAAGYVAGGGMGGGGGGALGPGVGESGSSSEAMNFFQSKGWTKEQSAGIVGNLQVESTKNLKTNLVGDNGLAYGIAQWHPDRQAKFQEVMGIPIRQSNFKQQLEFVQWELMNTEKRAGQMLKAASTAIEAARAVDYGYERSSHQHIGQRMANAVALAKSSSQNATPAITPAASTTPTATPVSKTEAMPTAVPSATSPRTETIGKEGGHGPISGAMHEGHAHGEKVESPLPSGDIVALGNALKKMGMDISEHPAFGGVAPKPVHKGSAHYEGRAIDINLSHGKQIEANDPVLGAKFDSLAAQLTRLGYKVYWRESGPYGAKGHDNHLHAEIPRGGVQSVPDVYQIAGTPEQRAMQGATPLPASAAPVPTPVSSTAAVAEPVQQASMTAGMVSAPIGADATGQLMSMMGGFIPGGYGGIIGGLLPIISSAISAELTPTPSAASRNTRAVNEAAVQTQAMQQVAQEQTVTPTNTPTVESTTRPMSAADQSGYAYNMPGDVGWPDWASMIGGNHWEEMKHFKKNMWG